MNSIVETESTQEPLWAPDLRFKLNSVYYDQYVFTTQGPILPNHCSEPWDIV